MKSNYRRIGDFIRQVKVKNTDGEFDQLLGINIDKFFMPSVANIVGTDLKKYKIVKYNQFACNRMHVGRDYRIPIALSQKNTPFIVSPAYTVFEIIDTSELHPEYLMMWFSRTEFDREAWFHTDADVRGGLPWDLFCDIELPLPSIEKQRAIVDEYNTIVNRITLNEKINQKLEETAQAIYKHWFVDFEFPNEEGKPYMSSGGKMVWNEVLEKEIPEGWENGCFSDILTQFSGYSFKGEDYSFNKGTTVVRGENVTERGFRWDTHKMWNKELPGRADDCFLKSYDIIVGMDGSKVGKNWGIIGQYQLPLLLAQRVSCLRSKKDFFQSYTYLSFFELRFENYVDQVHTGTSVPHISGDQILEFPIIVPSDDIVGKFHRNIIAMINNIHNSLQENEILEKIIELLLSKLATIEN